jgi:hypothetical protein
MVPTYSFFTLDQSTIKTLKKLLSTAIWADKDGLVFGTIACISSKNLKSETV